MTLMRLLPQAVVATTGDLDSRATVADRPRAIASKTLVNTFSDPGLAAHQPIANWGDTVHCQLSMNTHCYYFSTY